LKYNVFKNDFLNFHIFIKKEKPFSIQDRLKNICCNSEKVKIPKNKENMNKKE
jgi:hypothetical protein